MDAPLHSHFSNDTLRFRRIISFHELGRPFFLLRFFPFFFLSLFRFFFFRNATAYFAQFARRGYAPVQCVASATRIAIHNLKTKGNDFFTVSVIDSQAGTGYMIHRLRHSKKYSVRIMKGKRREIWKRYAEVGGRRRESNEKNKFAPFIDV